MRFINKKIGKLQSESSIGGKRDASYFFTFAQALLYPATA